MCDVLLDAGAQVSAQDLRLTTPLHYAGLEGGGGRHGATLCVLYLNNDLNIVFSARSPLHSATLVPRLLSAGAQIDARDQNAIRAFDGFFCNIPRGFAEYGGAKNRIDHAPRNGNRRLAGRVLGKLYLYIFERNVAF